MLKTICKGLVFLAFAIICFATFTYPISNNFWLTDLTNSFKLHYIIAAIILAFIFVKRRRFLLAAICAISICINLYIYTNSHFSFSKQATISKQTKQLKISSFNVFVLNDSQTIFDWVLNNKSSDIIILNEMLKEDYKKLQSIRNIYPYHHKDFKNTGGNVVLSKIKPKLAKTKFLPNIGKKYTHFVLPTKHKELNLYIIHMPSPYKYSKWQGRNAVFRALSQQINNDNANYKIVIGDLNIAPYSLIFKSFLTKSKLHNSFKNISIKGTWPALVPKLLAIQIDHLLHSGNIKIVSKKIGSFTGSDHLPVSTTIKY